MRTLLIALFALCLPLPAFAQAMCYNADQLEAEQGLRIHSELMIIALNCQHLAADGVALNKQYEQFTHKNLNAIEGYENTMRSFFRSEGNPNPESELNIFRTGLANRISNEAVRLQPNVFCHAYSNRIVQANAMDPSGFRKWAQTVFPGYTLSRQICQGVAVHTQADPRTARQGEAKGITINPQ